MLARAHEWWRQLWWRPRPQDTGYTVRYEWPPTDGNSYGGHDYAHLCLTHRAAMRCLVRDQRYWRRGPLSPSAYLVVQISAADFRLHHRRTHNGTRPCRAPDCANVRMIDLGAGVWR